MALVLHLQYAENLRGKADRLAKVTFRGVPLLSQVIENAEENAVFGQKFEWPVARGIESQEQIEIQIFNHSKYLSNRLVGTLRIVLQQLVETGQLEVSDFLLDDNNVVMKASVTFELKYDAPDGSVGLWQRDSFLGSEDECAAGEEERHLLGEERHLLADRRGSEQQSIYSSPSKAGSRLSLTSQAVKSSHKAMKSFRAISKMIPAMPRAKQRPPNDDEPLLTGSKESLIKDHAGVEDPPADSRLGLPYTADDDGESDGQLSTTSIVAPVLAKKAKASQKVEHSGLKAQDYQVCITIMEARQLAGLNMDPVVCVQVGDQKKYTSVKESTNCPYYNEYFVFDFHMAPAMLFDRIITLTVLHSRNLLRSGTIVGTFKFDVGTVYAAPDHNFHHKWAMLTDPEDFSSGPKGYLKCDISVMGKGDNVKIPIKTDNDEDDIEANLLLPDGVPAERQKAKIIVKIYEAQGLPKMATGMLASVKKAITGDTRDLVDPYVSVSFAGHKGKTSVKKGSYEPVWNEQIVFTEMFPPLCRRIKVQLRDTNTAGVLDDVIGTHFLDLAKISNEGEKGFLPTFGPCWINLYGSTRNYSLLEEHSHLNEGLGEGISYRARLLIALKAEILDPEDVGPTMVDLETCPPVLESAVGKVEEFFLFGSILESTMIDKRLGDKPVSFELSIGNYGNAMDGKNESVKRSEGSEDDDDTDDDSDVSGRSLAPEWHSTTDPLKPVTIDRFYYFLPYGDHKPCVWVKGRFEEHMKRMYNSNMIERIAEKLEDGLADVTELQHQEKSSVERRLRGVLEELTSACTRYVNHAQPKATGPTRQTKLDKERMRLCQREIDSVGSMARALKATVKKANSKEKVRAATHLLTRLRVVAHEPQHALPDIFVWMISNNKRVAYHRACARDLIFSGVEQERGKDCGSVQTIFMKVPGKKVSGATAWTIQSKLQMYLWLGLSKRRKEMLKGLPAGYEDTVALGRTCTSLCTPPPTIKYIERQSFQLRAHMYQGRSLIGSDSSGLSDPFARVVFGNQSLCTQVIDETLSPTWDEMLTFNEVVVHGTAEQIRDEPPHIVIEVFDQDRVGKSEFIGRALAKPIVKMSQEKYEAPNFPPQLEWFDIFRGSEKAGELLAAFELLQYPFDEREIQQRLADQSEMSTLQKLKHSPAADAHAQELPDVTIVDTQDRGPITPVPKGIRPTLSKHRIEVLFWGMRELKRIQFQSVDKPRIDVECAGHVLSSSVIHNSKKNPNFMISVKQFDVMLPETELYCPPITIRCVDCRNFGRFVLVGTHVINHIHKFMYEPQLKNKTSRKSPERKQAPAEEQHLTLAIPPAIQISQQPVSTRMQDVAITIDETQPLLHRADPLITINTGSAGGGLTKKQKTAENKKKKRKDSLASVGDDDEVDMDGMDWWSKYHASMDTLLTARLKPCVEEGPGDAQDADKQQEEAARCQPQHSPGYGTIPNGNANSTDDPEFDPKEAKKLEKQLKKMEKEEGTKHTLKGTAKAVTLAQKLSPKTQRKKDKIDPNIAKLKVYDNELEAVSDFNGFKEWLHTFELYRGKKTGDAEDDDSRVVGKFKGALKIYKLPLPPDIDDSTLMGVDPQLGLFQNIPSNDPIHVLVRIYIIKCNDLHPADLNGKADPYTVLLLGKHKINNKDSYISKQLNPVFGKCFEVEATFPQDSMLRVQVFDWDLVGSDDLIGETHIDLENRYYSRHRATCGLSQKFEATGYNAWRDPLRPSQILSKLCKEHKLDGPYYQPGRVRVASRLFTASVHTSADTDGLKTSEEHLALAVLQHWDEVPKVGCKLVPEHVETRPLYNPEKPGIEQGKIEMWVDMFPMDMPSPGAQVDTSPRKPKSYELRCIIWNTDDVVLEDDAFFTGEKMSDIYVKGWVKGADDMQSTDVHYRSLTGEGNFNWRFMFPFDYLAAEEKIVISRKETLFSWDETESKVPARLNLQVWDADHFSADDFLGCLTLDLNGFPRAAKSSKQCSLDMLKPDVPQVNLLKQKRVKGWWPFHAKNEDDEMELTGKVEAELHLFTAEDAEKHACGLGREEPDPLEKPNRPDGSFIWFLNPLKSIRYILWHNYKWTIIKAILFLLLSCMVVLFFYSMPGYTVKKIMGA